MNKKYNGEKGYFEYLQQTGQEIRTFEDIENEDDQRNAAERSKNHGGVKIDLRTIENQEFFARILSLVNVEGDEISLQTPNIDIKLKIGKSSKFIIFDIDGQTKLIARSMCEYYYHKYIVKGIAEEKFGTIPKQEIRGGYVDLYPTMIDFYSDSEGYGRFDNDKLLDLLKREITENTDENLKKEDEDLEPWNEEEQDFTHLYDEQLENEKSKYITENDLNLCYEESTKGTNEKLLDMLRHKRNNRRGSKGRKHRERGKHFIEGNMDVEDRLKLVVHILADFGVEFEFSRCIKGYENYFATCPFHDDDKNPSFAYVPEKGFFHCWGCQTGGILYDIVKRLLAKRKFKSLKKGDLSLNYGTIDMEVFMRLYENIIDSKEIFEYIIGWKKKLGIKNKI